MPDQKFESEFKHEWEKLTVGAVGALAKHREVFLKKPEVRALLKTIPVERLAELCFAVSSSHFSTQFEGSDMNDQAAVASIMRSLKI